MKKLALLLLLPLLLTTCAGTSAEDSDLKDCVAKQVQIVEIEGYGRRAPEGIWIRDDQGNVYDIQNPLPATGSAVIKTCKAYIKGTTLYKGEVTFMESFTIDSVERTTQ